MKRNLLKVIEEKMPTFSKGQKRIATYVIENYDKAAYMTAARLGNASTTALRRDTRSILTARVFIASSTKTGRLGIGFSPRSR